MNNVLLQIQLLLVVVIAHVAEALQDLLENSEGHHLNAFDRAALVADRCRVAAQSYQLVEDVVEKQVLWVMCWGCTHPGGQQREQRLDCVEGSFQ